MSLFAAPPMGSGWYPAGGSHLPSYVERCPENIGLGLDYREVRRLAMNYRPAPRPQKPSPKMNQTTGFDPGRIPDVFAAKSDVRYLASHKSDVQYEQIKSNMRTMTENSRRISAPVSPTARLNHVTLKDEQDTYGDDDDDEEAAIAAAEQEDELTGDDVPRTAAERRAEKRKMKRFRLTHNQTRFLMSEFARQAHPDAAQRERLSRDIPGLTARQVQVWFQNRRAKLKRFTSDDQERMMSTRALPEGFDMSQALHSPLEPQPYTNALFQVPATSPTAYASTFHDSGMMRPLIADQFRHPSGHGGNVLSTAARPAYHSFYTPPGSNTVSENVSPSSSIGDTNKPTGHAFSPSIESHSTNPFITSAALSAAQFPHAQVPRFPFRENMPRIQADFSSLTQRAGMSVNSTMNYGPSSTPFVGFHPQPMAQDHLPSYSSDTAGLGLGQREAFPYDSATTYQPPTMSPRLADLPNYTPGFEGRSQSQSQLPPTGYSHSHTAQAFPSTARSIAHVVQLPESHVPYENPAVHSSYVAGYARPESYYLHKTSAVGERNVEDVMREEHLRRNASFHP